MQTEEDVNLEEIQKKDFSTKLLFYYINFFKNNDTTTELLTHDEILKLNSIIFSVRKNQIKILGKLGKFWVIRANFG